MSSLSSEQQRILSAIEQVESDIACKKVVLEGSEGAMRMSDLVTHVCNVLQVNGAETRVAIYDILRMRDEGHIPKKTT